ncbi:MAG: hypothetical protein ACRDOH_09235 [Streptosporangiaceae bacterium]
MLLELCLHLPGRTRLLLRISLHADRAIAGLTPPPARQHRPHHQRHPQPRKMVTLLTRRA